MDANLTVTEMFKEMVRLGQVTPLSLGTKPEDLRLPGELPYIPTIAVYGTAQSSWEDGRVDNAELVKRINGNSR